MGLSQGKIKAILFDMDGLLLDTENIALTSFQRACRQYDIEPILPIYTKCIGTTYTRTRKILLEGYGQDFPIDKIYELWGKIFESQVTESAITVKEGAFSLLQYLTQAGLKKAVITSTPTNIAVRNLSKAELLAFFDFVLGGDQISNGKPHPEIYRKGCQKVNENPAACLALEDSDTGVLSAYNAGMQVIQVPDILEPSGKIKKLGHKIVRSLTEAEELIRLSLQTTV